jgi:hypothetical protein
MSIFTAFVLSVVAQANLLWERGFIAIFWKCRWMCSETMLWMYTILTWLYILYSLCDVFIQCVVPARWCIIYVCIFISTLSWFTWERGSFKRWLINFVTLTGQLLGWLSFLIESCKSVWYQFSSWLPIHNTFRRKALPFMFRVTES